MFEMFGFNVLKLSYFWLPVFHVFVEIDYTNPISPAARKYRESGNFDCLRAKEYRVGAEETVAFIRPCLA